MGRTSSIMNGMTFLGTFTGFNTMTAYAVMLIGLIASSPVLSEEPDETVSASKSEAVTCKIPGTALDLKMVPVPGPDGTTAFWMSDAEISWDHYDVFVYELDQPVNEDVDAVTRPTRPYISADRGWGHAGYPALSVSHNGAVAFCQWLSSSTGQQWRLPTVTEWQHACTLSKVTSETADSHAWHAGNSKRRAHKLRSKKADSLGLHDLHGNVAEWCITEDNKHVLVGCCFSDAGETLDCSVAKTPVPEWNDTDPQIPKSIWWLADAPFAGFRVVCESPLPTNQNPSKPGDTLPGGETP